MLEKITAGQGRMNWVDEITALQKSKYPGAVFTLSSPNVAQVTRCRLLELPNIGKFQIKTFGAKMLITRNSLEFAEKKAREQGLL